MHRAVNMIGPLGHQSFGSWLLKANQSKVIFFRVIYTRFDKLEVDTVTTGMMIL